MTPTFPTQTRRRGAVVIAVIATVAQLSACGSEDESPDATAVDVPPDAVAVVTDAPDGTVTEEDFDRALAQTATRQGLREVPSADDPQYELLADAAVSDLILSRWVLGEAAERGIEVTDREIDDELQSVKRQQFGSERAFQRFLARSGFTVDEARERIELQLISDRIQVDVLEEPAGSTSANERKDLARRQQELAQQFQDEFTEKWRARTQCANAYLIDRCDNGPPLDDSQEGQEDASGEAP